MIRLIVPAAGVVLFFLLSLATVRIGRVKTPRRFFLMYAAALFVTSAVALIRWWPVDAPDDAVAAVACLTLQLLGCLTLWNTFYSVLWGFSGTLVHELSTRPELRDRGRLIGSYRGDGRLDRMMARRLPNLVAGGWVGLDRDTLMLRPKGSILAKGARAAFRVFSLGMGGGVS